MEKLDVVTSSVEETQLIAEKWVLQYLHKGSVLCLVGDLGAGKTHFVKGIAKAFGINPNEVSSPTFTLIQEYDSGKMPLYHFDCYRLKSYTEAMEIGAEEYLNGVGFCCVEWPERIEALIPEDSIWIEISHLNGNRRKIFQLR